MEPDHGYHYLGRADRGRLEFRLRNRLPNPFHPHVLFHMHLHRSNRQDVHKEEAAGGTDREQLNIDEAGDKGTGAEPGGANQYSDCNDQRAPV